jgi:hypothetical protein
MPIIKYQPQSTQRPQSYFFQKTKNMNYFKNILSPLRPPGILRLVVFFSFEGIKIILSVDPAHMELNG